MNQKDHSVLIINSGSSSIKFALYTMVEKPGLIFSGSINRIGLDSSILLVTNPVNKSQKAFQVVVPDFQHAAILLMEWLKKRSDFDQIQCIGHRIVYGMNRSRSAVIDKALLAELDRISAFDPDHLPAEIEIIRLFKKTCPDLLQIACFDTAFFATLPHIAKMLPIPRRFDKAGVQRYGFHGLSYAYLMQEFTKIGGIPEANGRIVLAHLGNGASLAAVKEGRCIETSMGFTPAGGLMMGTRSGDLDPGVAWYMLEKEGMESKEFNDLVNRQSGLLGVSEISGDMRDLLLQESSDKRAAEAVNLFCYQVKKWIGSYMAVLGGLDTLIFSGGIGENAPEIRARICKGFTYAGIELNEEQNQKNANQISTTGSRVSVYVIPTNEELMIAKDTIARYREMSNQNV
ncbi:MAG: acetate/propionate family kinase [Saprospiraceae bacterium]